MCTIKLTPKLVTKNYDCGIDREELIKQQGLCPYSRDIINYLKHRILPVHKNLAKKILNSSSIKTIFDLISYIIKYL